MQSTATLTMSGSAYVSINSEGYGVLINEGGTFNSNGGKIEGNLVCNGTKNGSSTVTTR